MFVQLRTWCLAAAFLVMPLGAHGQVVSPLGISASGVTEIRRPVTLMRMQAIVVAEGNSAAEALKTLQARRDILTAQLGQLGASVASIRFEQPRLWKDINAPARQLEQVAEPRMGRPMLVAQRSRPGVAVATTVTAQWPLSGSPEEVLVRSQDLHGQIAHAIKTSWQGPDAAKLDEVEQTIQTLDYGDGLPQPGEPMIVYVARLSAEQRNQATAAALERAKAQASQLAKAAGVTLGPLQGLSQTTVPAYLDDAYGGSMKAVTFQKIQAMGDNRLGAPVNDDEMIGPQPPEVRMLVEVNATWGIVQER